MTFSTELAAFRAHTADPGYAALILLGTRQPTTAALMEIRTGQARPDTVLGALMYNDVRRLMLATLATRRSTDEGRYATTFDRYMGLKIYLEDLLGVPIDLATPRA
jgi:hypothetical protein